MEWVSYTRAISSKKDEENPPDVIGRQNAHIEKYLREHGFKLRKKYSDRKYSADKAEAFNLLVQDGMKRDFDGIVVDSVFRFGRDFWTAKEILADTFYPAGIQFAVVEDDFCSIGKEKSEVLEYFKKKRKELTSSDGILRYARSLESGVIPRTMIKYGFVLSEDNRSFEIEEEGATVIRKIYEMFISGKNFSDIAKELNKRGITSPQEQKALKAGKEANVIVPGLWYGSTIKRILNDPMYMGKAIRKVRGEAINYSVPSIVSESTFAKAQELLASESKWIGQKRSPRQPSLLNKRIYSKETGIALKNIPLSDGERVYVFDNSTKEQKKNYIPYDTVYLAVKDSISTAKKQAQYIDRLLRNGDGEDLMESELEPIREKARILFDIMNDLYLERMNTYCSGDGSVVEGVELGYQKRFAECEVQFKAVMEEAETIQKTFSTMNPWVALYRDIELPEILVHEDIVKWIGIVQVDKDKNIKVNLKEVEWMKRLPKEWLQEGVKE